MFFLLTFQECSLSSANQRQLIQTVTNNMFARMNGTMLCSLASTEPPDIIPSPSEHCLSWFSSNLTGRGLWAPSLFLHIISLCHPDQICNSISTTRSPICLQRWVFSRNPDLLTSPHGCLIGVCRLRWPKQEPSIFPCPKPSSLSTFPSQSRAPLSCSNQKSKGCVWWMSLLHCPQIQPIHQLYLQTVNSGMSSSSISAAIIRLPTGLTALPVSTWSHTGLYTQQ